MTIDENEHLKDSFKARLDLLNKEIDLVDSTIARIDGITQAVKNWAIVVWAGSISIFLGSVELRPYLILTALLPFMFWVSDTQWRRLQKRSVFRQRKIAEFVNSPAFDEAFKEHSFKAFQILDPVGVTHRGSKEYRAARSFVRVFFFKEVAWFYGGLMLLSLLLGTFFLLFQ